MIPGIIEKTQSPVRTTLHRERDDEHVATIIDHGPVSPKAVASRSDLPAGARNIQWLSLGNACGRAWTWDQALDAIAAVLAEHKVMQTAAAPEPADDADTVPIEIDDAPAARGNELEPVAGSFETPTEPEDVQRADETTLVLERRSEGPTPPRRHETPPALAVTPGAKATLGRWMNRFRKT